MFRFFVFSFLCNSLPGGLSKALTDADESPNPDTLRCNRKCFVINNKFINFQRELKASIGLFRIVWIDLTLKDYVDEKCQDQTYTYSFSKLADVWMWSTSNTLTYKENVFSQPGSNGSSVTSLIKSVQGQIRAEVACTFNPSKDPTTQQPHSSINDLIVKALMEEVEESSEVWQSEAVLCYKERGRYGVLVCLTHNKSHSPYRTTPYHTTTKKSTPHTAPISKTVEWPVRPLTGFIFFIWVMFMLYSPATICLFFPTYVSSAQNTDLIFLEGPGHVSIRGRIANIVEAIVRSDRSRLRYLAIASFLLTPLSLLTMMSGLFSPPLLPQYMNIHIINPVVVISWWGLPWVIRGLIRVLFTRLYFVEPCFICDCFAGKQIIHQVSESLKEVIKQHLQIQPLIIVKCVNLLCSYFKKLYSTDSKMIVWSQRTCTSTICRSFFVLFIMVIALLTILLLTIIFLVLILVLGFYSCPMSDIFDRHVQLLLPGIHKDGSSNRFLNSAFMIFLTAFFFCPVTVWLGSTFFYSLSFFIKSFTIILKLENIPYLTLLVLSTSYCLRCYYSFTRKYDDLAAKLYRFLKKRVQQDDNQPEVTLEYNKKKVIPKYIFDKACLEVMPLAENIGKLLLRVFIILAFFFLVFTIVTETPGVPDRMKITAMFLVAVMPIVIEMVILKKGDEMKKLRQEELGEKIQSIVDEYYHSKLREDKENVELSVESPTTSLLSVYYSTTEINV